MGQVRRVITPAIVSYVAASDNYKPKRLLTDSKMDHEIDRLIEEQELLSPPFSGGICDDTSLETPSDYIKIIPGKTPGFDHVKFARLKAKYLDGVNQEFWAVVEKAGMSKANLEAADADLVEERRALSEAFWSQYPEIQHADPVDYVKEQNYKTCSAKINGMTCNFITDKLKRHGLKSEKIIIEKAPYKGDTMASVEQPLDYLPEDISILRIYCDDSCFKVNYDAGFNGFNNSNCLVFSSRLQMYDILIAHEISHLLHRDHQTTRLVPRAHREDVSKIQEKRADVFAVFSCDNPVMAATGLRRDSKKNDHYDHRASSDWAIMTDEIISCYSDEIQAKCQPDLLRRSIAYVFGYSSYLFPKIEHVNE